MPIPVTAIFDIGKTNKKFFLFDENLNEIKEEYVQFPTIKDDDGFECDDLEKITQWAKENVEKLCQDPRYEIKALNFSGLKERSPKYLKKSNIPYTFLSTSLIFLQERL